MSRRHPGSIQLWPLARGPLLFSLLLLAVMAALLPAPSASASSFVAVADAYVDDGSPSTNFGTSTSLRLDASPTLQRTFIRFVVDGLTEPVTSARLRFICTNGGPDGGTVWTISGPWTETDITWLNQPGLVNPVTQLGAISCDSTSGTAIEYDVTSVVTGNGTYDFALTTSSGDGIRFRSRELAGSAPSLVINPTLTSSVDQIHLSWTSDPATTMTLMWHSDSSNNPASVQYGPDISYGFETSGTTFPSTGQGYLHRVTLTGLTPGTLYHYRVSADDGSWSADHSFRTAPLNGSDFRFLAAADMGTPKDGKHLNSVAVSDAMAARAPGLAFAVGGGDYWYAIGAGDEATVDQWFNQNEALMSEAPFMPAFGNHDKDTSKRYYTRFSLPPPENYYSFRYGGAHFLVIDTNVSFLPGSAQRSFIEADLQAAASDPSINWIFAVLHHPPFASSSTYQDLTVRNELSPLFDLWGVDIVITGHAHFYERTYPVRADGTVTSTDPSLYPTPGAPIYLVTGGGGADPQSSCSSSREVWSVTCQTAYEFLEFNVTPTSVQVSTIGIDGVVFDGFTLFGNGSGDTTPPSQPQGLTATAASHNQVDLAWQGSTDDTGVASYDIYRDGSKLAAVSGFTTVYSDTTVSPSTTYMYTVMAFDAAGNQSPESDPAAVTTPAVPSIGVLTLTPTDDAYVRSNKPDRNYGARAFLWVDGSPKKDFLLKFAVSGVAGRQVVSAKLRLYNINSAPVGGDFHLMEPSWSEATVTWGNAPAADAALVASLGRVSPGNWYEVDLTPAVNGDGVVSLRVTSSSSNGADYYSKEGPAGFAPQLIVTVSSDGSGDTTPPSQPQGLAATAASYNQVDLSWQASTDDAGVASYDIYRDGAKLATVSGFTTAYSDTAVSSSTTYSYTVVAFDAAGNQSPESDPATVTTPAAPSTEVLTFTPTDDAYVRAARPDRNYGTRTSVQVDASPQKDFLLKFSVSGVAGRQVVSAKLRLYDIDPSSAGGDFHLVADSSWSEATVTWDNAPVADAAVVASLGSVSPGNWYEVDLAPVITGDGTVSLRVTSSSANGADYYSKEGPAGFAPQLVVTVSSS